MPTERVTGGGGESAVGSVAGEVGGGSVWQADEVAAGRVTWVDAAEVEWETVWQEVEVKTGHAVVGTWVPVEAVEGGRGVA